MKGITLEDLRQKIQSTVVLHKGIPVYVQDVYGAAKKVLYIPLNKKNADVKEEIFSDDFSPPTERIGMVNVHGTVVYVTRMPHRRYSLGLTQNNLVIERLKVKYNFAGYDGASGHIKSLHSVELGRAILGKYPSFQKACKMVRQEEGAVAFDRQFCVDSEGYIHYKTAKVGLVNNKKIVFAKGFEHLTKMLSKDYDKDC